MSPSDRALDAAERALERSCSVRPKKVKTLITTTGWSRLLARSPLAARSIKPFIKGLIDTRNLV